MSREDWDRIRAEARRLRSEIEDFVHRESEFLGSEVVDVGLGAVKRLSKFALRAERLAFDKNKSATSEGWPLA